MQFMLKASPINTSSLSGIHIKFCLLFILGKITNPCYSFLAQKVSKEGKEWKKRNRIFNFRAVFGVSKVPGKRIEKAQG